MPSPVLRAPRVALLGRFVRGASRRFRPGSARPARAGRRGPRVALVAALTLLITGMTVAEASAEDAPPTQTVWGMGDSLFFQCGDSLGVGERSLGMVGWWGGTSTDMRARMSSGHDEWPYMTETSHAEEVDAFRRADSWVIGLGTNDVRFSTLDQFRANVAWFMQQSRGRQVLWFDIHYPQMGAAAAAYNDVLRDAARRWSNLRILEWQGFVRANPGVLHPDGVHLADHAGGCERGRFALIRERLGGAGQVAPPAGGQPPLAETGAGLVAGSYVQHRLALGDARGSVRCELKDDGCLQEYANGVIAWTPDTGVRAVTRPEIRGKWQELFSSLDTGPVGYPTEDTVCGLRGGGCRQEFQTGSIYWSPGTGARLVHGPMRAHWLSLGGANGMLGYPLTDSNCSLARSNGCYQIFEGGSVYWSITTRPQVVRGALYARWGAQGWETGQLGYPLTDEYCGLRAGGCYQWFQGGTIYFSPATGARVVRGAIHGRWSAQRWELGPLGYPISEEGCGLRGRGCWQVFQGGSLYFSPGTGAHPVWGAIRDRWAGQGWETGPLGYPTTAEHCGLRAGGCYQWFQGGTIYFTPATGAQVVWGAIHAGWMASGAERGRLGYPVTGEYPVPGGVAQRFQGGTLTWAGGRLR